MEINNKTINKIEVKTIEVEGVKYYEKSEKLKMKVSDYGIKKIKGSDIEAEANIKVNFIVDPNKEYIMLSGYLNNKIIPNTDLPAVDSYGDVPTGKAIYELTRLENNPVACIDHQNSASMIGGNYISLKENKQGLHFKEILRPLEDIYHLPTKDAVSAWGNGFGVSYSIGGRWLYDWEKSDPANNLYILVKAILHEASHVAIGADQWALSTTPDTSMVDGGKTDSSEDSKGDIVQCKTLAEALEKYVETDDECYLSQAEKIKKGGI